MVLPHEIIIQPALRPNLEKSFRQQCKPSGLDRSCRAPTLGLFILFRRQCFIICICGGTVFL